jgi:SAM-dependent methyltransferase
MLRTRLNFVGDIFKIVARIRTIENMCSDVQVALNQVISLLNMKHGSLSIPPKHLQIRVAGIYNERFFTSGLNMINDIEDILKSNGETLSKYDKILDFGCGCGRLMIPLCFRVPPEKIFGTDIDKHAIRWLNNHCPSFQDLDVNRVKPPTKYSDGMFDFIYGVSVFTHLPEKMQNAWLEELSRILKPGGLALFTTHGEKHYSKLAAPALSELMTRGFYYSVGSVTDGLPEFYQTSYQTHEYIERRWAKYFEVIAIRKEGIGKNQDAVLVRKRA